MDNRPAKHPIPPELQPLMDAEFEFAKSKSAASLTDLHSTLVGKAGVVSVEFIAGKLAVRYDPEEITGADIRELIRQAGLEVTAVDNGPLAPPIESADSGQGSMDGPENGTDRKPTDSRN
jgi:hypothetical protein